MSPRQLAAGDPIEARCTKCRTVTNHTIVAMTGTTPVKVECNTCHGQHRYRSPQPAPQKGARKTVGTRTADQKKWAEISSQIDGARAQAYSVDAEYKVDDLIRHPQFGLGQVKRILGARKMEVLFAEGLKIMRCK